MVLVIHGGGWRGGDKLDHRDDVLRLAGQGYVAAAINYRLLNGAQNTFPAAISDARCAVRWLRQNAVRFGGDATRLLTIGASAGANSAALLAVAANVPELDDGTCALQGTPSVTGAVSLFGRMDLARPPIPDYVEQLIGRTGDWQTREARASPVTHVSRGSAPLLLVHGAADTTVPPEHSRLMDAAMAAAGAPSALVEVAAGHGFPLFSAQTPAVGCSTLQFLSLFVDRPLLARPVRTVIFVSKETNPGERLLLRGGHDQSLDGVPMRYLNATATDTALVKAGDGWLDWHSDSALDWTTDAWRPEWGRERRYLTDGFGVDPENRWGPHHWKLDVLMDGALGDWFEFKTLLRTPTGVTWEGDVSQVGTPAATTNHWGRKGVVTVVRFGVGAAELTPLP
jgi:acetyl esterase/lipase